MLRTVATKAAKIGGGFVGGVIIDRLSKRDNNASETETVQTTNSPKVPNSILQTGNQRLGDISRRIAPAEGANPIVEGITHQYDKRVGLVDKCRTLITQPSQSVQNAQTAFQDLADDARTVQGAVNITRGNASITPQEATQITGAVIADTAQGAYKTARGAASAALASVTTTPEGIQQVAETIKGRATHDAAAAAAGLTATTAVATALGMVPHPAAKAASIVLKVGGPAAAGADLSEKARKASGKTSGSAAKKVIGEVLREKATNKTPSDTAPAPSTSLTAAAKSTPINSFHAMQLASTIRQNPQMSLTQCVGKWMDKNWAPTAKKSASENLFLRQDSEPMEKGAALDEEEVEAENDENTTEPSPAASAQDIESVALRVPLAIDHT
ncbi:hypothetical protein [Mycetohabitans endofungorum]|uniref:hypothetical protein n=1 Tax=Mycetohabitans endofungorum TaxID=417203 RepID=UPI002B0567FC|nr:hypothetical protein [Mycetohabitans endofungorum]